MSILWKSCKESTRDSQIWDSPMVLLFLNHLRISWRHCTLLIISLYYLRTRNATYVTTVHLPKSYWVLFKLVLKNISHLKAGDSFFLKNHNILYYWISTFMAISWRQLTCWDRALSVSSYHYSLGSYHSWPA